LEQDFIDKIVSSKQKEVEQAKKRLPLEKIISMLCSLAPDGDLTHHFASKRNFQAAINIPDKISLIAEVKKASPSKGVLRQDFDPVKIAREYQYAGAAAISVLTDEAFFGGHTSFIGKVKDAVRIPILRKDFIIDEYQIYQSALIEADCILLIADILSEKKIDDFLFLAEQLNIDVLVESNTKDALDKVLRANAKIVGINNRNLRTFEIDLKITQDLIKHIPKDKTIVSESGIKTKEDIDFLKSLGVNAILVGEAFMQADNITDKIKEMMGGKG